METILKVECDDGLGYWFLKKHQGLYGGGLGSNFTGDGLHSWYPKKELVRLILEDSAKHIPPRYMPAYQDFASLAILKLIFEESEL